MKNYLLEDIHSVQKHLEEVRKPKIKISIKATKWNGIWLDLPGDQFSHSDIHILVKVGTNRDHLFAYFKHISVFRDKILKKGIELGSLDSKSADILFDNLPLFKNIPAYITGFIKKDNLFKPLDYTGKKGRLHYTIESWKGEIRSGDLQKIRVKEQIANNGNIKFESIGVFAHDNGYLFNTGNLYWEIEDWNEFVIKPI